MSSSAVLIFNLLNLSVFVNSIILSKNFVSVITGLSNLGIRELLLQAISCHIKKFQLRTDDITFHFI